MIVKEAWVVEYDAQGQQRAEHAAMTAEQAERITARGGYVKVELRPACLECRTQHTADEECDR